MRYSHRFRVKSPLAQVASFHSQAGSMAAITPPPIRVQMQAAPEVLVDNDLMEFTLWLGFFPIHWVAKIEQVSGQGFLDRLVHGPFRKWEHHHTFVPLAEDLTEVRDDVNLQIRLQPIFGPIGLGMFIGLPFLFAYRGWKTRKLLEKQTSDLTAPF